MHPFLVRTVPSADCSVGKGGCKDCSLILGGSVTGSSLVKIPGNTSNSSLTAFGEAID